MWHSEKCLLAEQLATGETWHRRLGRINSTYLNMMRDGLVTGNCEVCYLGKQ